MDVRLSTHPQNATGVPSECRGSAIGVPSECHQFWPDNKIVPLFPKSRGSAVGVPSECQTRQNSRCAICAACRSEPQKKTDYLPLRGRYDSCASLLFSYNIRFPTIRDFSFSFAKEVLCVGFAKCSRLKFRLIFRRS